MDDFHRFMVNLPDNLAQIRNYVLLALVLYWLISLIVLPIYVHLMHRRLRRMEQISRDALASLHRMEDELSRTPPTRKNEAMPSLRAER